MPKVLMRYYRNEKRKYFDRRNEQQSTEKVFSDIYKNNKWGGEKGEYCSGSGTLNEIVAGKYIDMMNEVSTKYGFSSLRAVDLGCGM